MQSQMSSSRRYGRITQFGLGQELWSVISQKRQQPITKTLPFFFGFPQSSWFLLFGMYHHTAARKIMLSDP
jgi:hypothetical protein